MTNRTENVKSLKKLIGAKPVEHILTEARNGSFSQNEAETFAYNLHPEARGALINTKIVFGGEAMELILSCWFEWGEVFMLTKDGALCKLISALKEARKNKMVFEIQGMSSMGSQDTTDARAGIPVASDNSTPVHPPSAPTKMVTKSIRKQVEEKLGPSYEILLAAIRARDIKHGQVEELGIEMGGSVNAIFVDQMRQNTDLVLIFKKMIDCWFKERDSDCDTFDALINILQTTGGLTKIVNDMKKAR